MNPRGTLCQCQMNDKDKINLVDNEKEEKDILLQLNLTKEDPIGHEEINWTDDEKADEKETTVHGITLEKENQRFKVLSTVGAILTARFGMLQVVGKGLPQLFDFNEENTHKTEGGGKADCVNMGNSVKVQPVAGSTQTVPCGYSK